MPHASAPVPMAPVTDSLVEELIGLFEGDPDREVTEVEHALVLQAVPGCLRELLAYRRALGRRYAAAWIDGAPLAAPNVVRLPDNLGRSPEPRGAA